MSAELRKQAGKQATDAIVIPKIRRENGRLLHPRGPPIIFLSLSDAGLSRWKGTLLAVLAAFHTDNGPGPAQKLRRRHGWSHLYAGLGPAYFCWFAEVGTTTHADREVLQ